MKTSFKQLISDLNRRHNLRRRLISMLCVLSILVSVSVSLLLTMPGLTASVDPKAATGIVELLTDNPTHNGWIQYFGLSGGSNPLSYNTEFVGSVWTDKSVFTQYTTSKGQTITPSNEDHMLGVLSAIGSSMAITGRIYTPTDVMLILDMSSSMYPDGRPATVKAMVAAVNDSIATLLSLNDYNRIGVTIYFGGSSVQTDSDTNKDDGITLLPLKRYEIKADKSYLKVLGSNSELTGISADATVDNGEGTGERITNQYSNVPTTAGTYAQLGVENARTQFLNVPESDTYITLNGEKIIRQPVFIFMSDGRPTAAHSNFESVSSVSNGKAQWGLNSEKWRTSDASDFAFQLTSSYSKLVVGERYNTEPLFYTLGLGETKVSMNVMDPTGASKTTEEKTDHAQIEKWWNELIDNGSVGFNVYKFGGWNTGGGWYANRTNPITIYNTDVTVYDEQLEQDVTKQFPYSISQMDYVDRYFSAADSTALSSAFEQIVNEIIVKSIYTPTQSNNNRVNTSGEVSFVDHIGEYMAVKEIKGVLMGGVLHTGAAFSKILVQEPETLGTLGDATVFGMAFWDNIMEQLGLGILGTVGPGGEETGLNVPAVAELNKLINLAYNAGQISYTTDTIYSNYIGWYADASDRYLGFWDGTDTVNQEHLVDPNSVPAQRIKTYFFQSRISGDDNQTYNTDMMYITVWVKENLATGQETVVFSVPASLLPTLKYFVKLDTDGSLDSLYLGSINQDSVFNADGTIKVRPIRLVYEVGLQDDITADKLLEKVDPSYLEVEQNVNAQEGKIYFYANDWERDQSTGYGKDNTYSYFSPSRFNDRYFYVEDMPILYKNPSDNQYYPCMSTDPAFSVLEYADDLYTIHPKYVRDGDSIYEDVYYMPVGDYVVDAVNAAQSADKDGQWYVPAGTDHSLKINEVNRFDQQKDQNITSTLIFRNKPTIDRTNHAATGTYVLAATLGNNGRIAVEPDGQNLQKKLVDSDGNPLAADIDHSFRFLLHEGEALPDYSDNASIAEALAGKKYTILDLTVKAGNTESGKVEFKNLVEYTWSGAAWEPKSSETPTWKCIFNHSYTVVELESSAKFFLDNLAGAKGAYQFLYGVQGPGENDGTIVATNKFAPWSIELLKVDSVYNAQVLPGAVFGLYSPDADDIMTDIPAEFAESAAFHHMGEDWYLTSIETTDDAGQIVWQELMADEYLIHELKQPDGYHVPDSDTTSVVNRSSADGGVLKITIANVPGEELPSTGGNGSQIYIFIGAGLMLASAALMLVYNRKSKEEHV